MRLAFHEFGEGENLIILHGLFGISDNWVTIGKRLASRFRVFIPDIRNHGRSPHSPVFSYPSMVEDIIEFYDERVIRNAVIIGHSLGGKVAMNFALKYPDMVNKLVVVDISPRHYPYRQQHVRMIRAMLSVDFDKLQTRQAVEDHLATMVEDERLRLFILKNLHRYERGRLGWRLNLDAINNNLDAVFEGIPLGRTYLKETLFIKGGMSGYITKEDERLITTLFPLATLSEIEGASHWVHSEKPDELCEELSKYLRKTCETDS